MKQELKSGIPEFDNAVEQFENGEINFLELTCRLWNTAYAMGKSEQLNLPLAVIKSLPDSDEIRMKARELDEKDFAQWMWELQKGNVL